MKNVSPYTEAERRDLSTIDVIFARPDDSFIAITHKQLSVASKVPRGSISYELARAGIKPAHPSSNVYRVGDLKAFVAEHAQKASVQIAVELSRKFAGKSVIDVETAASAEAVRINKVLLAQRE